MGWSTRFYVSSASDGVDCAQIGLVEGLNTAVVVPGPPRENPPNTTGRGEAGLEDAASAHILLTSEGRIGYPWER